MATIAHSTCY